MVWLRRNLVVVAVVMVAVRGCSRMARLWARSVRNEPANERKEHYFCGDKTTKPNSVAELFVRSYFPFSLFAGKQTNRFFFSGSHTHTHTRTHLEKNQMQSKQNICVHTHTNHNQNISDVCEILIWRLDSLGYVRI